MKARYAFLVRCGWLPSLAIPCCDDTSTASTARAGNLVPAVRRRPYRHARPKRRGSDLLGHSLTADRPKIRVSQVLPAAFLSSPSLDKFSHSGERSIRFFLAGGRACGRYVDHVAKYFPSSRVSFSNTPLPSPAKIPSLPIAQGLCMRHIPLKRQTHSWIPFSVWLPRWRGGRGASQLPPRCSNGRHTHVRTALHCLCSLGPTWAGGV